MKKRIMVMGIAILMLFACMPAANAEDDYGISLNSLQDDINNGSYITLNADETVSSQININKEVTVNLNGHTITKGDGGHALFYVGNGGNLTIVDESAEKTGAIVGTNGDTAIVSVVNGTFNLNGGSLRNNTTSAEGGAVYVLNGTMTMNGGEIVENTAAEGGGIYATGNSNITINTGSISNNASTTTYMGTTGFTPNGGGGITIEGQAINMGTYYDVKPIKLTVNGGSISNNYAENGGGGISIQRGMFLCEPEFVMTGGSITNNTANLREGGGIRLEGKGSIVPSGTSDIEISGNKTNTSDDLGGGGIFVVNTAEMEIHNAIITNNTADGLGGGIGGCLHGQVSDLSTTGAAIYDNTANAQNFTTSSGTDNGDTIRRHISEGRLSAADGMDYFSAGMNPEETGVDGQAGSVIGDVMPGGGHHRWTGVDGGNRIEVATGSAYTTRNYLVLTAHPEQGDIDRLANISGGKVLIHDNYSHNHGGGIGVNGVLLFGAEVDGYNVVAGAEVAVEKKIDFTKPEGSSVTTPSLDGYAFELYKIQEDEEVVIDTLTTDASGRVDFDIPADEFDGEGEYTFYLREKADTKVLGDGYTQTYDPSHYTIKVNVMPDRSQDQEIEIGVFTFNKHFYNSTVTITKDNETVASPVTFTNEVDYKPASAQFAISGTKKVEGTTKQSEFVFELQDSEGNVIDTATLNTAGTFTFNTITYDKEGTYNYTVVEKTGAQTGWTYDNTIYSVTVDVEDVGGKLHATPTYTVNGESKGSVEFTNKYKANSTKIALGGEKKVVADNAAQTALDREFTFTLKDSAGNVYDTQKVTGVGKFTFKEIEFDEEGEFVYTVQEEVTNPTGWTDDPAVYTVTIKVEDIDGQLVATPTYTVDEDLKESIVFTNTYKALETSIQLGGYKSINTGAPDSTFEFELVDNNGTVLQTRTITGEGEFTFDSITYTDEGTFNYTIREKAGTASGWTYDKTNYSVVVTVGDVNGQLEATTKVTKEGTDEPAEIVFDNQYKALSTNAVISGRKIVSTGAPDSQFTFVLLDENGNELQSKSMIGDGTFSFDPIPYEEEGVYTYTVEERSNNATGWTYDDTRYTVVVTVTDQGGQLVATPVTTIEGTTEPTEIVFTNSYKALGTKLTLGGTKNVNSGSPETKFVFTLFDANNAALETKEIIGSGAFEFSTISYDEAGVYTYTVVEKRGDETGWTYDDTVYTIVVTVTDVNGQLKAEVSYTTDDGVTDGVVFTNNYKALSTSIIVDGIKNVSTGAPDSEFAFDLKNESGEVIDHKTITGAGRFSFAELVFDEAGTYRYTVSENIGNEDGWTYDDTVYQVVVNVQDVDGHLEAVVHISENGNECEEIVFQNEYEEPEIPRTGQNWMIVLMLGAAGILLIAGAFVYSHAKRED